VSAIELHAVAKRFGATPVLVDVELTVPAGSLTAILGTSGSGKTTMMRLIAGFDGIDAGTLAIGGRVMDDGRRTVRPQHRGVGYVPQDGALFPHLTVAANVGFGLPRRERPRALALLERVGLSALAHRYPHQLSGGEQQRVALARALAVAPSVVLLDEPFNALDASLRTELGREVMQILAEGATTTVLVTHDRSEALALADRIAVLDAGRIVALDDPRALYGSPADLRAATSIGEANLLAAEFEGELARCALGDVPLAAPVPAADLGARHALLLRPEQLALSLHAGAGMIPATIHELYFQGHEALAYLQLDDPAAQLDDPAAQLDDPAAELLLARIPGTLAVRGGERVWVSVRGPGLAVALEPPGPGPPSRSRTLMCNGPPPDPSAGRRRVR
jgi:iron(III) transport system ATP-binding protein